MTKATRRRALQAQLCLQPGTVTRLIPEVTSDSARSSPQTPALHTARGREGQPRHDVLVTQTAGAAEPQRQAKQFGSSQINTWTSIRGKGAWERQVHQISATVCVSPSLRRQGCSRLSSSVLALFLFSLTHTSFLAQSVLKSSVRLYFLETGALINAREASQPPAWFCSSTGTINSHRMGSSRICLALISTLLSSSRSKHLVCHFWSELPDQSSQVPQGKP